MHLSFLLLFSVQVDALCRDYAWVERIFNDAVPARSLQRHAISSVFFQFSNLLVQSCPGYLFCLLPADEQVGGDCGHCGCCSAADQHWLAFIAACLRLLCLLYCHFFHLLLRLLDSFLRLGTRHQLLRLRCKLLCLRVISCCKCIFRSR